MRARFLGKDPETNVGDSPTLFATDRTEDVLKFYARKYQEEADH
jgi:hypothetical protein